MADSGSATSSAASSSKPTGDRREFLKIGAGAVVGAAAGLGVEYIYFSGVTSNKDSTITSLQNQVNSLSSTNSSLTNDVNGLNTQVGQLNSALSTANSNVSTLQGQLASAQTNLAAGQSQINSLTNQVGTLTSQNTSLTSQVSTQQAQLTANASQISSLETTITQNNSTISGLNSQVSTDTAALTAYSGNSDALVTLGVTEAAAVTALANTIIPADSNGPGAVAAGVIYFIDRQLNGEYGHNGKMYRQGPYVPSGVTTPITINSTTGTPITYSAGTFSPTWFNNFKYQYNMIFRDFWRYGIDALETYANTAYGGNYETLSAANQLACLTDLFNNKPTTASFNYIVPSDFANEVFFMVWCGFLMDPIYGGNRGMVGWVLTASPGLNNGNFYGEGQTPQQRMLSSTPMFLKPASMAQFQQSLAVAGVLSPP